jgi:hypothetical protein
LISVPTVLQRQGILTEGNQGTIDNPTTGVPFTGNTIPATQIGSIAQGVANPCVIWRVQTEAFPITMSRTRVNAEAVPQFDVKMDWQASEKDHVFGRESLAHRNFTSPSPGNVYMFGGPYSNSLNRNAVLDGTPRFRPTRPIPFVWDLINRYSTVDLANAYGIDKNND